MTDYPVHPLICLGLLKVHIVFIKLYFHQFQNPYFKLDVEQVAMSKLLLIKQETEQIEQFCSTSLYFVVFWRNYRTGRLLERGI